MWPLTQYWDQGEHAPSVLDHDVVKKYTANIYYTLTLSDPILSIPSYLVLTTAL